MNCIINSGPGVGKCSAASLDRLANAASRISHLNKLLAQIGFILLGFTLHGFLLAADAFPLKTVRIVAPFAAGGARDLFARTVAQKLNEIWRQPVIVENRAGGGGSIGTAYVAQAAPDGYTLLFGTASGIAVAPNIMPKLPYDPIKNFVPIIETAFLAQVLSTHPALPVKSVKQLVALAKARPGELMFGSAGMGSASHMAMALFQSVAKIALLHIPYKGTGPAMIDLLGGHLALMFDTTPTTLPQMRAGKLNSLAISSLQRSPLLPQIPTISESGYPGFETLVWFGLFAPAGLSGELVKQINEDTIRALDTPQTRERLASQGMVMVLGSPADFSKRVTGDVSKWRKVIQEGGFKVDGG